MLGGGYIFTSRGQISTRAIHNTKIRGKVTPPYAEVWLGEISDRFADQYIGRTGQRLDARVKLHVPTKIRLGNYFADHINYTYGSAFAEHLINNCECASTYSADLFTILSKSHSDFHLKV